MSTVSRRQIRILHVDDEPDFADLTATHLERENDRFAVETATSADEGFEILADRPPDCIVSDYDMPGTSGIEFLETVRDQYPDLPFILYTGKGSEAVAGEAISAGVTEYIQKESGTEQYALLANRILNAVTQHRAEQDRQRHLQAIESVQEGISILNDDGEFIYVNERYADLYGYDCDELLGEHWELIYPDEEVSFAREEILPTVAEEGVWHGESTGLRADGTTFPEEHVVSQTQHDDLVCTVRDLSEQRNRETELWLKTHAMDEAPVGITFSDPSQDDNPLIYANERFEELTGYDEHEVVGRNCRFLQGEGTDPEPVAAMREAIDAEEPVTVELRNYRKDGTEFWNRIRVAPITTEDGTVTNYAGFQEDITERKESEQRLERQNERLDEFVSIVSHELRNPLNTAELGMELAQKESESESVNPHLKDARRGIDRCLALLDDLVTLARRGERVSGIEPVELADVAESSWQTVDTGDAILATDTSQVIEADRSRLQELFENLYRNAVEHGGDDVTVHVGGMDDGFYVADTGPGIPERDRAEVFKAGYSTSEDGTGLGLRIVEQIAEAHEWDITVPDGDQGGARFEISDVDRAE